MAHDDDDEWSEEYYDEEVDYAAVVQRGIERLDYKGPKDWRATITQALRRDNVDMGSCSRCVLGHLYGEYRLGVEALFTRLIASGRSWFEVNDFVYGFDAQWGSSYAKLLAAWKRAMGISTE